jgi:Transposase IS116/IS110/IS902 family
MRSYRLQCAACAASGKNVPRTKNQPRQMPQCTAVTRPGENSDLLLPQIRWHRTLLDQIDALTARIGALTARIEEQVAAIGAAWGIDADGSTGPGAGAGPGPVAVSALDRLDEIPGISRPTAQGIIAEIGLDMSRFPAPGHLVSWAKLSPRTIQSGAKNHAGRTSKGNPYLKAILGEAAAAAARTDTFLGERYRRIVKRRGKLRALVALARTILVIIWHLLASRTARFRELGAGYYASRTDKDKKPAATSASSKHSDSPSPSSPPHNPAPPATIGPAITGQVRCRALAKAGDFPVRRLRSRAVACDGDCVGVFGGDQIAVADSPWP